MQVKTKELEIPKEFMEEEWQTNKVKIRKWDMGIRNDILDQVTEFNIQSGKNAPSKIQGGYSQNLIITKCTVEAPWQVGNLGVTRTLDPQVGDWLYKEITTLNAGGLKNPPVSAESLKEKQ